MIMSEMLRGTETIEVFEESWDRSVVHVSPQGTDEMSFSGSGQSIRLRDAGRLSTVSRSPGGQDAVARSVGDARRLLRAGVSAAGAYPSQLGPTASADIPCREPDEPELARWASRCEDAVHEHGVRLSQVRVGCHRSRYSICGSTGHRASYDKADYWSGVEVAFVRGGDVNGGVAFAMSRSLACLDPVRLAGRAAEAAFDQRDARDWRGSGRYDVIFTPYAVVEILEHIAESLVHEDIVSGRYPWQRHYGATLGSALVAVVDDPTDPDGPCYAPFDDEGTPTGPTVLIEEGTLVAGFADRGVAESEGVVGGHARRRPLSTPAGTWNPSYLTPPRAGGTSLRLRPGVLSVDELQQGCARGIVVEEIAAGNSGIDLTTGSIAAAVRGWRLDAAGTRSEPFRNAVLMSSFTEILDRVVGIANEAIVPRSFPIETPAIAVEQLLVRGGGAS